MIEPRLRLAEALFDELISLPAEQRTALLATRCAGDAEMRALVEKLLKNDDSGMGGFLRCPVISTAPSPGRPLRIGRYEIVREIGRGGSGVVYEARQENPQRSVALKVVGAGFASAEMLRRFAHEAEILGALQHPGIAQIYEAGTAETSTLLGVTTTPYFAMELVRGDPLTAYAARLRLDVRARLELVARVCDAVQFAHQRGVIHRDLKPANILVCDETTSSRRIPGGDRAAADDSSAPGAPARAVASPKILDFGVARATGVDFRTLTIQTEVGQLIGTVPYMSPEQLEGDSRQLDTRSDVYALGVVLFELLSGTLPHDVAGRTLPDAIRIVREQPPRRLGAMNRALRGEVETLCAKALERDRQQRYQSASDLAADIRRYLAGEPIDARRGSFRYVLAKRLRRHWLAATIAASFVLLLAGGLVTSLTFWRQAAQALVEKEQQRALAERRAAETHQVAAFQAEMLARIDVAAMGRGIKKLFRQQVRAGLQRQSIGQWPQRRRRTPDELEADLVAFDRLTDGAQGVDVARRLLGDFVLRDAARTVTAQFTAQPRVQAELLHNVGTATAALGLYDDAERDLREALELRRAELGDDHPLVAESLNKLAVLLNERGQPAAAEPVMRDALAIYRAREGPSSVNVANALASIAGYRADLGDLVGAEPLLREALAMYRAQGEESADVAYALNNLACLVQQKGEYDEAQAVFDEAIRLSRAYNGDQSFETATYLQNLAALLHIRKDLARAEAMFRDAIERFSALVGNEQPQVAIACLNLAIVLNSQQKSAEAEPICRSALELLRKLHGDEDYRVAAALEALAGILRNLKRLDEVEPLLRESLALNRRLFGDEDRHVVSNINQLGHLAAARSDFAAAAGYYRQTVELAVRLLGEQHPDVGTFRLNLARMLVKQGELVESEPLLRTALETLNEKRGPSDVDTLECRVWLSRVLLRRMRAEVAQPTTEAAAGTVESAIDSAGAEPAASRSASIVDGLKEAEALLLGVEEASRERRDVSPRLYDATCEGLVELYEAWQAAAPDEGRADQAAGWRETLATWRASR